MTTEPTQLTEADKLPTSVWQGEFSVCGVAMKCHVLSDGRRIIEEGSLAALFTALPIMDVDSVNRAEMDHLARWMYGKDGG